MNTLKSLIALLLETVRRVTARHIKMAMMVGIAATVVAFFAAYQNRVGTVIGQRDLVLPGEATAVQVIALSMGATALAYLILLPLGLAKTERISQVKPDENRKKNFEALLQFAILHRWVPSFIVKFVRLLQRLDNKLPWVLTIAFFSFFQAISLINGQVAVDKLPTVAGAAVMAWVTTVVTAVTDFRAKKNRLLPFLTLAGTLLMISWGSNLDLWAFLPALIGGIASTAMAIFGRAQSRGGFGTKGPAISAVLAFVFFGLPILIASPDWHWWSLKIVIICAFNGLTTVAAALMYNWTNKKLDRSMSLIVTGTNAVWSAVVGLQVLNQPITAWAGIGIALMLASAIIRALRTHRAEATKNKGVSAKPKLTPAQQGVQKAQAKLENARAELRVAQAKHAVERAEATAREGVEKARRDGEELRQEAAAEAVRLLTKAEETGQKSVEDAKTDLAAAKAARKAKRTKTKPQSANETL